MTLKYTKRLLLVGLLSTVCSAQPDGVGLCMKLSDGAFGQLVALSTLTGDTMLSLRAGDLGYCEIRGPAFSHDGTRIACVGDNNGRRDLLVMDNDGTNLSVVCPWTAPGECYLTLGEGGYVYFGEGNGSGTVHRVHTTSGMHDTLYRFSLQLSATDILPSAISNLTVCADGSRGASVGGAAEGAYAYDFVSGVSRRLGLGCRGTISPNGARATRNTSEVRLPDNSCYSWHQVCVIHDVTRALDGESGHVAGWILAPGAQPGAGALDTVPRFIAHRFSHTSDDLVVWTGTHALAPDCYVSRVSTGESWLLATGDDGVGNGVMAFDFCEGGLPPPPEGPWLETSSSVVSVSPSVPSVITVVNTGESTPGPVSVAGMPSWLTVNGAVDADTQVLSFETDTQGLAPGSYHAWVRIQGGGARNFVRLPATLSVGTTLHAPTGLEAFACGDLAVWIEWADTDTAESLFVVERTDGSGWRTIGTAARDSVRYCDASVSMGAYRYRVRAVADGDSSGYSNEAVVVVSAVRAIEIHSPAGGEAWPSDSQVDIRWLARGVGQVLLQYSVDHGETRIPLAPGAVGSGWPMYGVYTWDLPDLVADSVLVIVQDYDDPSVLDLSEYFAIRPPSSVRVGLDGAPPRGIDAPRLVVVVPGGRNPTGGASAEWFTLRGERVRGSVHGAGGFVVRHQPPPVREGTPPRQDVRRP